MIDVNIQNVIGLFEEIETNDEKVGDLKGQMKMINADSAERFKEYAKTIETKPATLKKAYKHWKESQNSEDPMTENEDFYTIISLLDLAISEENQS